MINYNSEFIQFIRKYPSSYHSIAGQAKLLEEYGYHRLYEGEPWQLKAGGGYYVVRGGTSIAAFRIPAQLGTVSANAPAFMIMASHSDAPCFKVKERPEMDVDGAYTKLNVETYGGAILNTWLDKPLGIAGRLCILTENGLQNVLTDSKRDLVLIPNIAIHMNHEINKGFVYNPQKDLLPLFGGKGKRLLDIMTDCADIPCAPENVLGYDLYLYNRTAPSIWGAENEYLSAPRLDDQVCAWSSLVGFLESSTGAYSNTIPVHVVFDNEEVGSTTKQGAASTFLKDTLLKIAAFVTPEGYDADIMLSDMAANSFMLSADNAHAIHPNAPERCDPVVHPHLGGGVVLKFSANQRYTTDGESAAISRLLCTIGGVKYQTFFNRSDMPGGSTLGNISTSQLPIRTADVGIAQLAMHSSYETCSTADIPELIKLARTLFGNAVRF